MVSQNFIFAKITFSAGYKNIPNKNLVSIPMSLEVMSMTFSFICLQNLIVLGIAKYHLPVGAFSANGPLHPVFGNGSERLKN